MCSMQRLCDVVELPAVSLLIVVQNVSCQLTVVQGLGHVERNFSCQSHVAIQLKPLIKIENAFQVLMIWKQSRA